MPKVSYFWVDVFADTPFAGNPLCVILDGTGLTDGQMQAIARETNLSETTFVFPPTVTGATHWTRIFTPGGELAFAGHPTLGTAAALVLSGRLQERRLVQQTRSGLTTVDLEFDGATLERVVMEAPQPVFAGSPDPAQVAGTLGLQPGDVTWGGLRPEVISAGVRHLVIPVDSPETLAALQPDTRALLRLSRELDVIGAYCFTFLPPEARAHARARLFAPLYGIVEDPATGSGAAPLGAYLHRYNRLPAEGGPFWYEQGIEMGRPSRIWVEVHKTAAGIGVRVGGRVVRLGSGEFSV